jgi:hypothetical protein
MGITRTFVQGAATWRDAAGTLLVAAQPEKIAALVEEDYPEMGPDKANGKLGQILAEADGCLPDAWFPLS